MVVVILTDISLLICYGLVATVGILTSDVLNARLVRYGVCLPTLGGNCSSRVPCVSRIPCAGVFLQQLVKKIHYRVLSFPHWSQFELD
jgi:hypothetical protein